MEKLTPDAKYLLAKKLSGEDLVRLCATDVNMRQICFSPRYNEIWKDKLKQDYNMDYNGENSYMMYLQHTYFYKQEYWIAIVRDLDVIVDSKFFKSSDEAIQYLAPQIQSTGELPFPIIEVRLKSSGKISLYNREKVFEITSVTFDYQKLSYKEAYDKKLKEIGEIIYKNSDTEFSEENFINKFVNDFRALFEEYLSDIDEYNIANDTDRFIESLQNDDYNITDKSMTMIKFLIENPDYMFE